MSADAIACALAALADLAVIAHLRILNGRRDREERVRRSLKLAVRRELSAGETPSPRFLRLAI